MARDAGHRRLWPWLGLGLSSLLAAAAIVWDLTSVAIWRPSLRMVPPATASRPADGVRPVRLFFPTEAGNLAEVEREIPRGRVLRDEVAMVLSELGEGKGGSAIAALSAAGIRQVFLDAFGILYLDFGPGFEQMLTTPEQAGLALRAVVATLTSNFEPVKRVQFLMDGHELATAVGDLDLRRPLAPRSPEAPVPPAEQEGPTG